MEITPTTLVEIIVTLPPAPGAVERASRRAVALRQHLIDRGVAASRLRVSGVTDPEAQPATTPDLFAPLGTRTRTCPNASRETVEFRRVKG